MGDLGVENLSKRLINSREGKVTFEKPRMTLDILMKFGQSLTQEQVRPGHPLACPACSAPAAPALLLQHAPPSTSACTAEPGQLSS